ncbi:MAG: site-2 protease family protein [Legionella sp.]
MLTLTIIQKIAVWTIPLLLAITLHEAAHAWAANRLGDNTAKALGRLSFNPFHHIDPIGTLCVPILIGILSQFSFIFGWAKPIPINWHQLNDPKRDIALVAVAGPLANILMAIIWMAVFKIAINFNPHESTIALFFLLSAQAGLLINLILAIMNLLPIPPLDGSRILVSMLSPKQAATYLKIEPYGFMILLLLCVTGILGWLLNPALIGCLQLLEIIFNP